MTNTEIKKACYKQAPTAELEMVRGGNLYYTANIKTDILYDVNFIVPISDIGATDFFPQMEAKFLLRWLENEEN